MPRILLADDSPALLASVGLALRNAGHRVTSTDNGADALCLLRTKPAHDLVILDLRMPGMDGRDVLKELGPSAPPVVVITGEDVKAEQLRPGKVSRVVTKPFKGLNEFLAVVNEVLAGCPPATDPRQPADPPAGGCP